MTKKQKFLLIIVFVVALLIGGTIGFLIGTNRTEDDSKPVEDLYKTSCTVYISKGTSELPSASSSDRLTLDQLPPSVLNLENIYTAITESYPDAEIKLTLEQGEESALFKLIATSENRENLADICNMAAELLCAEIEECMDQASCLFVDYAKQPKNPSQD